MRIRFEHFMDWFAPLAPFRNPNYKYIYLNRRQSHARTTKTKEQLTSEWCLFALSSRNECERETKLTKKFATRQRTNTRETATIVSAIIFIVSAFVFVTAVRLKYSEIINWRNLKSFSFSLQSQWFGAAAAAKASRRIVVTVESCANQIEKINKICYVIIQEGTTRSLHTDFACRRARLQVSRKLNIEKCLFQLKCLWLNELSLFRRWTGPKNQNK